MTCRRSFTALRDRLMRFRDDESGASAVVFCVSLPVIAGLLFMGVEAGHWRQANSKLQAAADEAVIAAALEYSNSQSSTLADISAYAAAMDNGAGTATSFSISYGTITTEVRSAGEAGPFYYAEEYHQQYLAKNPNGYCNHGFCQIPYRGPSAAESV